VIAWPPVRLGEHIRIKHGFAFQGEYFSDRGQYIVLTPGNFIESGGFKPKSGAEKYYIAAPPAEFVLRRGDLVIAMTEQAQGLLGSSALIPEDNVYLHNQRIGLVEQSSACTDLRFLYYLFNSRGVRDQIQATATGSKVRHTAPVRVESITVPLPPLDTQRKIAAVLTAYDDLIENNSRRIKLLEEMAQRIYREWFVEFRFPGHEDVTLVDSDLGPIPEGWEVQPFAALGEYVNGFAFKPEDWGADGIPIVKIRELKHGVTDETPRFAGDIGEKFVVRDGDLLFSWSADLNAYLWTGGKAWLNQHLFRVDPAEGIASAFLFHALRERMDDFRSRAQGTTMRHIKRAALSQVTTIVPPRPLRNRMAELVAPVDALTLDLVRAIRILRACRDLLLPRLVSGEVDVTGLDIATPEEAA
jgi:type I restriction enzyme S subunit